MKKIFIAIIAVQLAMACSNHSMQAVDSQPGGDTGSAKVNNWITTPDRSSLLQHKPSLAIVETGNGLPVVQLDTTKVFQTMDGFGFTLTGGSAQVIASLEPGRRTQLLRELFGSDENSIGISLLRLSIGASDLNDTVFTYDDRPAGQTDTGLVHFSLAPDETSLIPVLKEIVAINPSISFLASPWSPPSWMKDNDSSKGGSLKKEYYGVYAKYFVRYIKEMEARGIRIGAITPQNEPLHPGNNPSLLMVAADQAEFIRDHLGPAFRKAGLATKIIVYDHNCDRPDYPLTILKDAAAATYVDGSAFHLYAGDITALSAVHDAFPEKNVYFTEQYTAITSEFSGDLLWHIKNLVIGAPNNWSKTVLEWNLANDTAFGPHTPGGCTTCKGALTIGGQSIERNVAYYIIAHASKFVKPGSRRIQATGIEQLPVTAFVTPDNHVVLIALNEKNTTTGFSIRIGDRQAVASLPAGSVGTFVW